LLAIVGSCSRLSERSDVILVDLGDVSGKEQVETVVTVKNTQSAPRTIRLLEKDCSCLSAQYSDRVLPPGGEITLKLRYPTPEQGGRFTHLVRIHYREDDQPTTVIISGIVSAWLGDVQPKEILFEGCGGGAYEETVQVRLHEPWPLSQQEVELTLPYAGWTATPLRADQRLWQFAIVFTPPDEMEPQSLDGRFVVQWTNRPDRKIEIPCRAKIHYPWKSDPESLFLGAVKHGEAIQKELQLSPRTLRFSDVTARDLYVECTEPIVSGCHLEQMQQSIRVTVQFALEQAKPGTFWNTQIFARDTRNQRVLCVIPVTAYVE